MKLNSLKEAMADVNAKAETLYSIRKEIEQIEEEVRAHVAVLKEKKERLQTELLETLNAIGLKSIKVKSGDSVVVQRKKSYVYDEAKVMPWAVERGLVSINKLLVTQTLRNAKELPDGVQEVEQEFISVRKANKEPEHESGK